MRTRRLAPGPAIIASFALVSACAAPMCASSKLNESEALQVAQSEFLSRVKPYLIAGEFNSLKRNLADRSCCLLKRHRFSMFSGPHWRVFIDTAALQTEVDAVVDVSDCGKVLEFAKSLNPERSATLSSRVQEAGRER